MEASNLKKANDRRGKKQQQIIEKLHPLEVKFGLEPKIEPSEQWHWH